MNSATIVFVDVGQGDCTVIIDSETGQAIVIDCPAGKEDEALRVLNEHGATLHTAVVTHFDADHSAGLVALVDSVGASRFVLKIIHNETPTVTRQYKRILANHRNRGMVMVRAHENEPVDLGSIAGRVLGPSAATEMSAAVLSRTDRNRTSIILRFEMPASPDSKALLLAGDCDRIAWLDMLSNQPSDLSADFFRWPHHGAGIEGAGVGATGATLSEEVLDAVSPEMVYMGVGTGNSYGHPDVAAIAEIKARSGVGHYCSQVTSACASSVKSTRTPCAGDLTLTIDPSGTVVYSRPVVDQQTFVSANWAAPKCV
jgi:competence protein ComEC